MIRQIVQQAKAAYPDHRRVLIVGRDEKADFTMVRWVAFRIHDLTTAVNSLPKCQSTAGGGGSHAMVIQNNPSTGKLRMMLGPGSPVVSGLPFTMSDLGAAIGTDIDIANVPLSADDRMLIDAVAMPTYPGTARWITINSQKPIKVERGYAPAAEADFGFVLPSEIANVDPGNTILTDYNALTALANRHRSCNDDQAKAVVKSVDDFVATVNKAPDKSNPPLTVAAELSQLAGERPLLLRLAIEQVGGTATTRTSLWYSLGWPGAATVGAGLIASFRLVDQFNGRPLAAGFIRCFVDQQNIRKIHAILNKGSDPVACSYILTS